MTVMLVRQGSSGGSWCCGAGGGGRDASNTAAAPLNNISHLDGGKGFIHQQDNTKGTQLATCHILNNDLTPAARKRTNLPPPLETLLADCNAAKAMRYYRLWIYTCNGVLLLAVLVFCAVAGRTLVGDYRRSLVPGFALHQPSLLCAYLALIVQAGLLQAVGCVGALRLNERLLNAYWLMLLVLLLGDAAVGVFWVFRLEQLCRELRPGLKLRLGRDYGADPEFTELWDRLQKETKCCGVQGKQDFDPAPVHGSQNVSLAWLGPPASCCGMLERPCKSPYAAGCEEHLLAWLRHTADVLFVLGYCVIAFLKLCFLGILRYEIREMIQKIKMLQSEMDAGAAALNLELGSSPNRMSGGTQGVNANGTVCGGGGVGEREALLPPVGDRRAALQRRDSDATSGCALLGAEEALELREMEGGRRAMDGRSAATRI